MNFREFLGPPPLSDKMTDWEALCSAGGENLFRVRDVLDVGPAYGLDAFMFAFYARSYVVLDSSKASLAQVARVAPSAICVECALMLRWPVDDQSFDTVVDFSTFDDTGDGLHCYREAARVLRAGGTLVTSYANEIVCGKDAPYEKRAPDDLARFLESLGLTVHHRSHEDRSRAVMFATKPQGAPRP